MAVTAFCIKPVEGKTRETEITLTKGTENLRTVPEALRVIASKDGCASHAHEVKLRFVKNESAWVGDQRVGEEPAWIV